jgi:hypothetical protein
MTSIIPGRERHPDHTFLRPVIFQKYDVPAGPPKAMALNLPRVNGIESLFSVTNDTATDSGKSAERNPIPWQQHPKRPG